jgi:hypothetical protein
VERRRDLLGSQPLLAVLSAASGRRRLGSGPVARVPVLGEPLPELGDRERHRARIRERVHDRGQPVSDSHAAKHLAGDVGASGDATGGEIGAVVLPLRSAGGAR